MRVALILACLACLGHGRRVHLSGEQAERGPYARSQKAIERAPDAHSPERLSGADDLDPTAALAKFILALNPSAAYAPSHVQPGMRRASKVRHQVPHRCAAPHCQAPPAAQVGPELDLVGDAGVMKSVIRPGNGAKPPRGATVEVHYEGRLADTGAIFDSSRSRGKTFKFTLGQGKVIGGWEVGLSSMQVGELSSLECAPQYAYGAKGIPPMIPPMSKLKFEVELISVEMPKAETNTVFENNADTPRTPEAIKAAYQKKMAQKALTGEKDPEFWSVEGVTSWIMSVYKAGFFTTRAEEPIWIVNPLLTFPLIFILTGVLFYWTFEAGGIHRGTSDLAVDDLRGFLDSVPPSDVGFS
mmetsp:Transcript_66875/g.122118  ORF Transcript_66875/g.122118 Transcript_66875/m.122118 type:complete len:356 (-) Transcript_66875:24-1091(-)